MSLYLRFIWGFCLLQIVGSLQGQNLILRGYVKDSATREALPFASVFVQDGERGTTSDETGYFYLELNNISPSDTLVIAYLGYKLYKKTLTDADFSDEFLLISAPAELSKIVVTPLTARERLLKALQKSDSLLLKTAFWCQRYYIEEIGQNYKPLVLREAILNVYQAPRLDSLARVQIEVVEGRQIDNAEDLLAFKKQVKREQQKTLKRLKRQARKDTVGLQTKLDSAKSASLADGFNLGGPYPIFEFDFLKKLIEAYLSEPKSKQKKAKYKYEIVGYSYYQDRAATILEVTSLKKRPYRMRFYISDEDEIMLIDYVNNQLKVPFLVRTALALFGYSITDMTIHFKTYYRPLQDKWYMAYADFDFQSNLIDKHLFKPNDTIHYTIHSQFITEQTRTVNIKPIPEKKRLKANEPFSKQLGEYHPDFWNAYKGRK